MRLLRWVEFPPYSVSRTTTDSFIGSDTVLTERDYIRTTSNTFIGTDTVVTAVARTASDALLDSDDAVSSFLRNRTASDVLLVEDVATKTNDTWGRVASDVLLSTDTAAGTFSSIYDPRNLVVTVSGVTASLSWDTSSALDVLDYSIFRRSPPTGVAFNPRFDTPVAAGISATTYDDTDLDAATYEWQVFGRIPVA